MMTSLSAGAATFDELLSDEFETLPGQKSDADVAAKRLAAWCKSSVSGDWSLFSRRLARDGFTLEYLLARFASSRRSLFAVDSAWIEDAIWIRTALCGGRNFSARHAPSTPCRNAFEQLFTPLVLEADVRLWASVEGSAAARLTSSARACLRQLLADDLCGLCAPVFYDRFSAMREAGYAHFIREMQSDGLRRLFDEKPVLLRLIASITRQWLVTSREFVVRLHADLTVVSRDILRAPADSRVARIAGGLSDSHRGGRSVFSVELEDGRRVMYKPKDLRLDVAWHSLVERLNADAPIKLRSAHAVARDGYGWAEFIEHTGCTDVQDCRRFFRRAGAWLALFHCFAATDIHQENLIAAGDHPVPIDLETLLQAKVEEPSVQKGEAQAYQAARETISNSVMAVGVLPAYKRSPDNSVLAVGGVASDWTAGTRRTWTDVNSDSMKPAMVKGARSATTNLPHADGRYAGLAEHLGDFVVGFKEYATFLMSYSRDADQGGLFDGFAGLPVRKVLRPTQFYYMLLNRLKDDRTMDDGVLWSVQADFLSRLVDWDQDQDPTWPLQRAERSALLQLNVPLFVMPTDGSEISDSAGTTINTSAASGLQRARDRVLRLDSQEIAWQVDVIRQASSVVSSPTSIDDEPRPLVPISQTDPPTGYIFSAEADAIAEEISRRAIRRGSGAAWIGLGWLTDSEAAQLAVLGHDLYNGASGVALFLAAHATTTTCESSAELALAAVSYLRAELRSRNAPHTARLLGIGGATGMGSIIYALTVMSGLMRNGELLADAHRAATLLTDDLIAADNRLDAVGGSAGAILCLLRLYADTRADDVLARALKCGKHLLAQERVGVVGSRSWCGQGPNQQVLNGMSHGAAGFAYALASLATVSGREEFAEAALECLEFERRHYDAGRADWHDLRVPEPHWRSQWCHGAVGIGLARLSMMKRGAARPDAVATDIDNALTGATRGWPGHADTLCCGALGSVEFFREAGEGLNRSELGELASRRLLAVLQTRASTGDYRWKGGTRRFNLGLFRGLAGVGYTCLRTVDDSLPNVLIWE
jgi:type 2 lantibiotic biosynthesis protein LanM